MTFDELIDPYRYSVHGLERALIDLPPGGLLRVSAVTNERRRPYETERGQALYARLATSLYEWLDIRWHTSMAYVEIGRPMEAQHDDR